MGAVAARRRTQLETGRLNHTAVPGIENRQKGERTEHEGRPSTVSQPLPELQQVTALLHPYFRVSTAVSDEEKFIAAGVRLPG